MLPASSSQRRQQAAGHGSAGGALGNLGACAKLSLALIVGVRRATDNPSDLRM
jgi:hypothetical protein